jgi:CheY-like chemotaxis protein
MEYPTLPQSSRDRHLRFLAGDIGCQKRRRGVKQLPVPVKKILVIEDDAVVAFVYRKNLEQAGYEVHVASDGQAGLDQIQQFSPDGVVLDLMMPILGGISLLKMLRALPSGGNIPALVITNAYLPQMVEEALAAGATQVLAKGDLTPQTLAHSFRELLGAA